MAKLSQIVAQRELPDFFLIQVFEIGPVGQLLTDFSICSTLKLRLTFTVIHTFGLNRGFEWQGLAMIPS